MKFFFVLLIVEKKPCSEWLEP